MMVCIGMLLRVCYVVGINVVIFGFGVGGLGIGVLMVILCGPRLECIVVLKLTIVCGAWNR